MLTLFGRRYARNNDEAKATGAVDGFYKPRKRGIMLYRPDKEPIAYIVGHDGAFIVSASRRSDGRIWYMHGLSDLDRKALNAPRSYMDEVKAAESALEQCGITATHVR